MTDRELLYFKTIAEERNISAAAKKLFITQPALSHCIQILEQEAGTPLFIRTPKGLDMTAAGECYYSMASDILGIYEDYQKKLADISGMRRGRVCIGLTRYEASMILPNVLPVFAKKYPMIEVGTEERNSGELKDDIIFRRIDFAIMHGSRTDRQWTEGNLEYQCLSRDDFCVIAEKNTPYADRAVSLPGYSFPVLDIRELRDAAIITETPEHYMRVIGNRTFDKAGIAPRILLETDSFETVWRLAASGYGIAIGSERYVRAFGDFSRCTCFSIPREYDCFWTVNLVRHVNGYLSVAARALEEEVVGYILSRN